ncbi:uncharacterized protein [Palaemon carinicauda]|uniref:uncharacterized protein n=1 Tax=Palaemon carinicauda TaxID=392227 RepID=UPI0035B69622
MEGEMQLAKNDRAQAKRTFTRKCNIFEDTVGQASASTALTEVYEEVCKAFDKVEVCHERYVSISIKVGAIEEHLIECDEYIDSLERRKVQIMFKYKKNIHVVQDSSVRSVKVKALQPPQFSGDIRDFPNFRDDYKRLMVHSFGKDPYALRSCLSGEALNTVRGIENDYDEMLSRLDLRYGDNRKLVDAVLSDLKSIKPVNDGDNRAFVKMVERVDRCWLALQKMDLEGEMNTANTVSYIEKLLPITQKRQVNEEDMIASIKGIPEKHNELLQRVDQPTQIVTNLCKNNDTLQTGKCLLHEKGTHNTGSCSVFGNLGNFEKFETVRKSNGTPLNTLWDPGSDITLITFATAYKLGLKGRDIELTITKVGRKVELIKSKEYVIKVTDLEGKHWYITAYGIEEITSEACKVDLTNIVLLFDDIRLSDVERPFGEIELSVGSDWCTLMPQVKQSVGNLQLMQNMFGYCIRGSHPSIKFESSNNSFNVKVNQISSVVKVEEINVNNNEFLRMDLDKFFNIESLGTYCIPKCGACKCGSCTLGDKSYTIREENELDMISKGLEYNCEEKYWTVKYPWIRDPNELPNNVAVAIARMRSTEKRLTKIGYKYTQLYNDQIKDMLSRGVARKLSWKEMSEYDGPIHYIHHHEVLKESSTSTPVGIVFNSSADYKGHRLNVYWAKGPDLLNDLVVILLRFRQDNVAVIEDISKMYNAVRLKELDQHNHRFVWRDADYSRPPNHHVLTAVGFGDRPSGVIAITALKKTASIKENEFPEIKNIIDRNTYVDDIIFSCEDVNKAKKLMGNMNLVLNEGGFKIKHWIMSNNETLDNELKLLYSGEEKVLGVHWIPRKDIFFFKIKVDFNRSKKRIFENGIDINTSNRIIPKDLTKRMVLSQVSTIYDPLGLIIPFTLNAKVLMRELITISRSEGNRCDWDDPMSDEMREKWSKFFIDMRELEFLSYARCVKPLDAKGDPMLVIFSDGSSVAYGACAYVRWGLEGDSYVSQLILATNRIAPTKKLTIPRLELCGAILSCRLRDIIVKQSDWKFKSIVHIVDSSIVRAQIQKESYGFNTFVANRVAEIQSRTDPTEWWWVNSKNNPADFTTRPCPPNVLHENSMWQKGPAFMSRPFDTWPISQSCNDEVPDKVGIVLTCRQKSFEEKTSVINMSRFSSYTKLLRVPARIIAAFKVKSLKAIACLPTPELVHEAEMYLIQIEQSKLQSDWRKAYRRLGPSIDNGIIFVGERIANWLKENWNQDRFILMPSNSHIIKLYIQHLHNSDHSGVETTLAKLQCKYWVISARRLIKFIKNKCIACKRISAETVAQKMGQVAQERLRPTPPFYHTSLDLFGPITIRDTVKRRTYGKAYGVIFNCLVSRAVYVDLAESYDTKGFLTVFQRFITIRGYPKTIHSDLGSQLVAACKELRLDKSKLQKYGASGGTTWIFYKSADAPWQNGCSEALIKSVKRAVLIAIGDSKLTFGEMKTVLFEVGDLLNSTPIGIKPGSDCELGSYLCPNDLILGRASSKIQADMKFVDKKYKDRLEFMQRIVDCFWKKWQRDYFPTLMVRQKWHVDKRNVKPGDIVLVQNCNTIRGQWKLAQVTSVQSSRDHKVRDVSVRYKIQRPGRLYEGQDDVCVNRSVHRLVVLLPIEENC